MRTGSQVTLPHTHFGKNVEGAVRKEQNTKGEQKSRKKDGKKEREN
jgi:hypothetical protein